MDYVSWRHEDCQHKLCWWKAMTVKEFQCIYFMSKGYRNFYSSWSNLKRKIALYIPTINGKNDNIMRYNFSQISKFDREITHWDFKILFYICDMLHKAMSLLNGNYELPFYFYWTGFSIVNHANFYVNGEWTTQ